MRGSFLIRFFRMASVVMLLVAVALLSAITTMHFAIHGAEVQVPALKGMTVAEARSQAAGMGLNLDVDNRYYSATWLPGTSCRNRPRRARWSVANGMCAWPRAWARKRSTCPTPSAPMPAWPHCGFAALDLKSASPQRLPYAGAQEGTVLAQDPPAHAQGIAQPSVNMLVAAPDNATPDGYVMPDLTGIPVITAQAMLNKIGLKMDTPTYVDVPVPPVGTGTEQPKPPVAPGAVIAQQPMAGARVDQTTVIKLTAAK